MAVGACGVGATFRVARMALHAWEEPCISGKSGSGAIFFSGCPLKCVFCQNMEISRGCKGVDLTEDQLIAGMQRLIDAGAQNINLVSPTQYDPAGRSQHQPGDAGTLRSLGGSGPGAVPAGAGGVQHRRL